jgi:hypothetical protein
MRVRYLISNTKDLCRKFGLLHGREGYVRNPAEGLVGPCATGRPNKVLLHTRSRHFFGLQAPGVAVQGVPPKFRTSAKNRAFLQDFRIREKKIDLCPFHWICLSLVQSR